MYKLIYSQLTHQGLVRTNNEDAMMIGDPGDPALREKKGILFAVADGLGGLPHGEVASGAALVEMHILFKKLNEFQDPLWLREAFRSVNKKIYDMNKLMTVAEWMGTTLTVSVFFKDSLTIGHVGDSRMYQIRDGKILKLTTDHSIDRYTLTRVVGTDVDVKVDIYKKEIYAGDIYVQCSDGLYGMMSDEEIAAVAANYSPEESCKRLVALANEKGGADNITVQVIRVEEQTE